MVEIRKQIMLNVASCSKQLKINDNEINVIYINKDYKVNFLKNRNNYR